MAATTIAPISRAPDLTFLLSQASYVLTTELSAGLTGLGISPRAYCVLVKALTAERTQTDLADLCGLDKTTMVATVDELEASGLAERRPSRTDRRARIIAVTGDGKRLAARAQTIVNRIHDDVLAALPADERQSFVHGLERLVRGRLATPAQCERPVRRRRAR